MTEVALIDYGIGNLYSIHAALRHLGMDVVIDTDGERLRHCSASVIPGVARFGSAMEALHGSGQAAQIKRAHLDGQRLIGLCLGAQLLLDESDESPGVAGLGLVPGRVRQLQPVRAPVVNQGWHRVVRASRERGIHSSQISWPEDYFYFSHSYRIDLGDPLMCEGEITYGGEAVVAIYQSENVTGIQFHPELSGKAGMALLHDTLNSQ